MTRRCVAVTTSTICNLRKHSSFFWSIKAPLIVNIIYFAQQSCGGLPGRTGSRCSSATHDWFAPHRRHLGILGAAVQVGELLQLGLSDLIIVILHTAKPCVHTRRQQRTRFQLHWIKFQPLSPRLQPREYLINVHLQYCCDRCSWGSKTFQISCW